MKERIQQIIAEVEAFKAAHATEVEDFRIRYLGKKGVLNDLFADFKLVAPEHRKETGRLLNELKNYIQNKFDQGRTAFDTQGVAFKPTPDLTMPVDFQELGARHPVSLVMNRVIDVFGRIGFPVAEGPEIEDDWHNFSALNFPPEHPARDMQDTFFLEKNPDIALRTHTSSVQIRYMEKHKPPLRAIFPGRVYRNEAISARAHCLFHQVEGLYVDKNVSFADLKQTLLYFAREMFDADTKIRLRPSFFPFTEPSAEMDISCNICSGKGCNICKYTGWVEILGCGMVDPSVLENCGINSMEYTGYAFGIGMERMALLLYQINDLRLFFENDLRFLKQFTPAI
ncbi:MAG: phenylalanine--tRNA ligase subunit alpha [Bacteroidales bacterium]|nr:phenylalanine--tRNA ligase subunit alpha [Bacteroidales bacterium]MDZ4205163.1 phenylalanine--tRNA ligase subunit alpha [Bacteroidales bacterium]